MCSPKPPFCTDNCMRMINSLKYDTNPQSRVLLQKLLLLQLDTIFPHFKEYEGS